jgi:hypothetical protein
MVRIAAAVIAGRFDSTASAASWVKVRPTPIAIIICPTRRPTGRTDGRKPLSACAAVASSAPIIQGRGTDSRIARYPATPAIA